MHILISTKITRDRWKRELKHRCLLQHLNLLQQRDKQHYYILFWDSFFGLVNYPRAFSSQSSELAFDSCRDESKLYIQNKYSVCTNLSSLPVCFQWPEQLKQARFWSLFMTLMRIQICSNTFTSKVCEVWEMHFTSCKMGITTFSSPHYSFNEIINWREFIVQFRLPLQLWQKGEALTVSKLWHGAAKDMRCHHHPLRISSCSTGCDFGEEKAKPQELACTELLINVNISPQSNQQMLRISNWSAISIKCGSWQPCL